MSVTEIPFTEMTEAEWQTLGCHIAEAGDVSRYLVRS